MAVVLAPSAALVRPARTCTSAKPSAGDVMFQSRSVARFSARQSGLCRSAIGSSFFTGTRLGGLAQLHALPQGPATALTCQMNIFSRLFRVVSSYGNSIVSGLEDPEKMLEQTVNEMQADVIKMRQASAQVLASQKQIEAKYDTNLKTAQEWMRRAELAVQKGDDELAREALKRKKSYQEQADQMKIQLDAQKTALDGLLGNTKVLENKLIEAKSKKDTLKARAKSAATSKQINDMISGLNTSNAAVAFDKMEEKVLALEAEAEATMQLGTSESLEGRFALLEGNSVDDELSKLKKNMLGGQSTYPKVSLPEGRPIKDAIDMELEELRRKAQG